VADFIDELVDIVKTIDPECLCTFANFPPTEFLSAENVDFLCFNVYLHAQKPFENYLSRLQMMADTKPLIMGEFGIDSLREGEAHKCEILRWQIESCYRAGLAGAVVYSFTDEWSRMGARSPIGNLASRREIVSRKIRCRGTGTLSDCALLSADPLPDGLGGRCELQWREYAKSVFGFARAPELSEL